MNMTRQDSIGSFDRWPFKVRPNAESCKNIQEHDDVTPQLPKKQRTHKAPTEGNQT